MSIILFVLFGLVVGLLARAILPGRQSMGLVLTTILGVVGALVGGYVASLFTHRSIMEFNTAGVIGSILGAVLVVFLYTRFAASRQGTGV